MASRATWLEMQLFMIAVIFISGAPSALYIKATNFVPPVSALVIIAPVLSLMVFNMVMRLRETLFGVVTSLPWFTLGLLALISVLWSVSPWTTLRESLILLIMIGYIGMVAHIADWDELLGKIWQACIILILLTYVLFFLIPSLGQMQDIYERAITGPWFEKNATGQFFLWAGIVNIALIFSRPKRLLIGIFWVALIGVSLYFTQSATALLLYVLALCLSVVLASLRRSPIISLPASLLCLMVFVPAAIYLALDPSLLLNSVGKSTSLTGRIPIWETVNRVTLTERPLLGFGYGAFWSEENTISYRGWVNNYLDFKPAHSHNALLEARLDLGWVGASLWLLAIAQLIIATLLRLRSSSGAYFAVPLAIAIPFLAYVETSAFSAFNLTGFLLILTTAKMTLNPTPNDRVSGLWHFIHMLGMRRGPTP